MRCPLCGEETKVVNSRPENDCVNRSRKCTKCGYRFQTIEIDSDMWLKVVNSK